MTVFIRLIIVLALNLLCLQSIWAVEADVTCKDFPEPSVKGNSLSNIVKFQGDIISHPLGKEVDIVIPLSVSYKSETRLKACFRWKPKPEQIKVAWEDLSLRVIPTKEGVTGTTVSIRLPRSIDHPVNFWRKPIAEIHIDF